MDIPTVLTQPLESAMSPAELQPPPDLPESSPEDYFFQRILQSALQLLQCLQRTSSQSLNWNPRVLSLWPKPLFFFPSFPAPFTLLDQWDCPAPCFDTITRTDMTWHEITWWGDVATKAWTKRGIIEPEVGDWSVAGNV